MTGYRQGLNDHGELVRDFYVEHDPVDLDCQSANDGMTRQEFRDECDINFLMAGFEAGKLNWFDPRPQEYLDVSDVPDLPQALSYLEKAQAAFMSLPANVRRQFDQDPLLFVEFAQQPANQAKMAEWGLAKPPPVLDNSLPTPPSEPAK